MARYKAQENEEDNEGDGLLMVLNSEEEEEKLSEDDEETLKDLEACEKLKRSYLDDSSFLDTGTYLEKSSVHVANVDYQVTETQLKSHFQDCGKVKRVTIPRHPNGFSKAFAYVEFETPEEATRAIRSKNNTALNDRHIRVTTKRVNFPGMSYTRRGRFARRHHFAAYKPY